MINREPVQVRSLDLIERLLAAAKQSGTPEGRYVLNRLKTRAKAAQARQPKVEKRRKERKAKGGKSFSDLMHLADRVFSLFIRFRGTKEYPSLGGRAGFCVTCREFRPWQALECGHWIRRENWGTRWDDWNCHVQDKNCNHYRGGEEEKHAAYIEQTHGPGACDRLRVKAKLCKRKPKDYEVKAIIKDYAGRLALLGYTGDLSPFLEAAA